MSNFIDFEDRIVAKPLTFSVTNNDDGTITLIPVPGAIEKEGTPINANTMNGLQVKIIDEINKRVLKEQGKGLSSCDFTKKEKDKLAGIAEHANNYTYTHPTGSGNKHIPSGGSAGQILRWSSDGTAVWGNDNNTTYNNATATTAGLMSANDKKKLDNLKESIEGFNCIKLYENGSLGDKNGNLSQSFKNFHAISVIAKDAFEVRTSIVIPTSAISIGSRYRVLVASGDYVRKPTIQFNSNTSIAITDVGSTNDCGIIEIYGLGQKQEV